MVNYPGTRDWFTVEADAPWRSGDLNGGTAPTWMAEAPAKVRLRTQRTALRVYALDGAGRRRSEVAVTRGEDGFEFAIGTETPWYEVVGE
jgi:hypothetical protein